LVIDFEIRGATHADLDTMLEVLTAAGLSTREILDHGSLFWVACHGSALVGTCGLEIDGTNGLIRSVAVAGVNRSCGIGRALVKEAMAYTGSFFLGLGWEEVSVEAAADLLQNTLQVKRYEEMGWYADERAFVRTI
jgi:N-acetylglutamate synthase-like GNAT family acetyltransferase